MLNIPFENNPGKACALACHAMTARHFFPDATFEKVAQISDWQRGYVVWAFKFWLWIIQKGVKVIDYDLLDLSLWAEQGIEGLKGSISENEYNFIVNNTKEINSYSKDIKKVINHPNFTFKKQRPTWQDLVNAFREGAVCEVVLDSKTLNGKEGFALHRVVVLDINDENITFHDPSKKNPRPARIESIDLFKKAWLDSLEGPELCIYKKEK